jgi:CRP/FNR family transcriptional regulator, cyclic AMP receptor protein
MAALGSYTWKYGVDMTAEADCFMTRPRRPAGPATIRLGRHHLSALTLLGRPVRYIAGDRLMTEGEPGDSVIVIHSGQIKAVVSDGAGRDHLLGLAGPGDLVGEMACLDRQERSTTVIALSDLQGTRVPARVFVAMIDARPAMAQEIACVVAARLRSAQRLRLELGTHEVPLRLAHSLSDLAGVFARDTDTAGFVVPLSQDELAQLISASEVSVQRALRSLRSRRLVTTGYRRVEVPCAACLELYDVAGVMGCYGLYRHRRLS